MLAHKADTEERHRGLSAANFATWPQLHPRAFISRSTDLLHVSFGRPLLLFPAGVQRMAILGIDVGGILFTWPIHLHLLFFTSNEMGSIPVRSWSSALVILFGQKMCRILLRHLFWNTSGMWHIPLVTFQDSAALSGVEINARPLARGEWKSRGMSRIFAQVVRRASGYLNLFCQLYVPTNESNY